MRADVSNERPMDLADRPPAPPGHLRTAASLAGAASVGVLLGTITQVLQGSLSGSSGLLANSGVVWALAAFGVGLAIRSAATAAFAGSVVLVAASFSYYLSADWFEGVGFNLRSPTVWSVAGVVAGSTLGLAGYHARRSARHRRLAGAVVAGIVLGEGAHVTWMVGNPELRPAGLLELAAGALITVGCWQRTTSARFAPAIAVVAGLVTVLALRFLGEVFIYL